MQLPKTGPVADVLRELQLGCSSSHYVAVERALEERSWEEGAVSKTRDVPQFVLPWSPDVRDWVHTGAQRGAASFTL